MYRKKINKHNNKVATMNFKKIISGLFVSSMFLASAYATINTTMNNADQIGPATSFTQLDSAITI
jgi:hypothetical protein